MNRKLSILILILFAFSVFSFGVAYGQTSAPVITTTEYQYLNKYIDRVVERVVQVEKIVTIEKIIPVARIVIKEVPLKLRNFQTTDELQLWLENWDNPIEFVGVVNLNEACVYFATQLQRDALQAGYYMSVEVITPQEYYQNYGQWKNTSHALNLTIIGKQIYFIEPQTKKVWLRGWFN